MLKERTTEAAHVPETARAGRHNEHGHLIVFSKLVELCLSLRERVGGVDAEVRNLGFV